MSRKIVYLIVISVFIGAWPMYSQIVEPLYEYGSLGLAKSMDYYEKGLIREAETALMETVRKFPDAPTADKAEILQAKIDLHNGNYKLAVKRLTKFIRERSNSPLVAQAALERAYMTFENKEYDGAEKYFFSAKKIGDEEFRERDDSVYYNISHKAVYWRAVALTFLKRYDDASESFQVCINNYPKGMYADDAMFALGLTSEIEGRYETALNYYTTLEKDYPYSNSVVPAKIRQVNNHLILREAQSALIGIERANILIKHIEAQDSIGRLYEKQSYFDTAPEETLYLKGEAYNMLGNYDKALDAFYTFLDTFKLSGLVNYVRLGAGWALINKKEYSQAINYYNDIINAINNNNEPVKALALLYRAIAMKRNGNVPGAQKNLSELSVQPDFPFLGQVLLELGEIYYESGDFGNASRSLERGLRESGDDIIATRLNLLLGATYMEQQRWSKAASVYAEAERLASKNTERFMPKKNWYLAEALLKRGIAEVNDKSYNTAMKPLQTFIGTQPGDSRIDEALFWLAEAYYRAGLLNNAADYYDKVVTGYPKSKRREEALYGLGWSYFKQKKFRESSEAFDRMIKDYPKSKYAVEVLSRQGDGYFVMRDYRKAADAYLKAAEKAPRTDQGQYASYQRCYALYKGGMYSEAITALQAFAKDYPNSSFADNALYLVGWIRFQLKKYDQSIEDFKYLLLAYPTTSHAPKAYYAIGDAYYNQGKYEKARAAYQTVVDKFPDDPFAQDALKGIQYSLRALGKDVEADSITAEYSELNPESLFAMESKFNQSLEFYMSGKNKDAITEFEDYMKKYPESAKNAEALYWIGKSYINLNEPFNAERIFSKLQRDFPASDFTARSMVELGMMYTQQNQPGRADSIFSQVIEKYPDQQYAAQAGFEMGIIKFRMGDTTAAINIFRDIADKYPDLADGDKSRYQVAMYYRGKGLYDSARTEFALLSKKKEENPVIASEAQYRLGEMWMRDKNYVEAIKAFKDYIGEFPKENDEWYKLSLLNMGEAYENLENYEEAINTYKSLVALSPDDDYGKTAAKRLKRLEK